MTPAERHLRLLIREELSLLHEVDITVGDVKKALEYARGKRVKDAAAEVAKEAGKKAGMLGLKSVLSLIPGAAAVQDAIETGMELKDLYSAATSVTPDVKKANPLWDILTVDPDTTAILDDEVEARFIKALGARVAALPDDTKLPDADTQLNNWMKGEFGGTQVTKGT